MLIKLLIAAPLLLSLLAHRGPVSGMPDRTGAARACAELCLAAPQHLVAAVMPAGPVILLLSGIISAGLLLGLLPARPATRPRANRGRPPNRYKLTVQYLL